MHKETCCTSDASRPNAFLFRLSMIYSGSNGRTENGGEKNKKSAGIMSAFHETAGEKGDTYSKAG